MMGSDPENAVGLLKLTLENVMSAPELAPEVRSQLRDLVEAALHTASQQAMVKAERDLRQAEIDAESKARERISRELFVQEEKVNQLMARFNSLMDEERYRDAEAIANIAEEMSPGTSGLRTAELTARMVGYTSDIMAVVDARHRGVVDSMFQVERSHIPQSDEPPILYPDPEVWQLLTERRKKFKAVDLTESNPSEAKIVAALDDKTELEFVDQPLSDVMEYLKERHGIEIQLDTRALTDAGLGSDTPVTRNIKGISLRSALRLMLGEMDLTYVIRNEVLMITSKTEAENMLTNRVYPVADIVIPVGAPHMGGMGGRDDGTRRHGHGRRNGRRHGRRVLQRRPGKSARFPRLRRARRSEAFGQVEAGGRRQAARKPEAGANARPNLATPAARPQAQAKQAAAPKPVEIEFNEGDDPAVAWNDYFAAHKGDEAPDTSAVREKARELMQDRKFDHVIALISAALRNQQGQPWMFEALGLAMQADQRSSAEIERALLSALDFAVTTTDMMYLAQYLARVGLEQRALQLFRQASELDPTSPEPYAHGLRLAQRLDDLPGIQWATVGILSQAWPNDKKEIWDTGFRVATATLERLRVEHRKKEANEYKAALDQALERDCVVVVSWTGDADVDLMVEEPSGTICSFRFPRTTAGGLMLGDAAPRRASARLKALRKCTSVRRALTAPIASWYDACGASWPLRRSPSTSIGTISPRKRKSRPSRSN